MNKIAISIIIPVYNVEKYLRDCLDSVIQQNFREYEVICVNDASLDDSGEILSEYVRKYSQIKVFNHAENRGLSAARNTGLMHAEGQYVLFVDSDDMIAQGMFQELYRIAVRECVDILCFDFTRLYEGERYQNDFYCKIDLQKNDEICSGKELFCRFINEGDSKSRAWQQFIKRDFLKDNGIKFYEGILHEDELFCFLCYMNAQRTVYVNEKYYIYRKRNDSIMATKDYRRAESIFVILVQVLTYWNSHVFTEKENCAIEKYFQSLVSAYHMYRCYGQKTKELSVGGYVEKAVYKALQKKEKKYFSLDDSQLKQIEKAENVIVFGAGNAAADIINLLRERKIKIAVIAVSSLERNAKEFCGLKVDTIENVAKYLKNAVIVIGVLSKNSSGIREKLEQLNYSNIITPHEINETVKNYGS